MSCDCSHASVSAENERKTLRVALVLNATMFVVGMAAGLWAQSSGLMADALDMLTDATAYALGLMAGAGRMRIKPDSARRTGGTPQRPDPRTCAYGLRRFLFRSHPLPPPKV